MRILLTGANGQLGHELCRLALTLSHTLITCSRNQLDITNPQLITSVFAQWQPDLVVNAAAFTAVDNAEQDRDCAFAVNRDGAALLAQQCAKMNIPLLHLSTDYVFSGHKTSPYQEEDATAPLNIYGQSKWEGEVAIRQYLDQHLILRVSGLFGVHGHNFVKTILRLAANKEELRIVHDQIICPTAAAHIAQVILQICAQLMAKNGNPPNASLWGTYHYCSQEPTTWFDFATTILSHAQNYSLPIMVKQVLPILTQEYKTPAQRPLYSVLDCHKIKSHFGITQPSWQIGLTEVMQALA